MLLAAAGCAPHAVHSSTRSPAGPAPAGWIAGPRGRLRVDDGGADSTSPPVLFVHGNGGNRTQWSAQLSHLRASRRAIAFDLAGMGESELAPDAPVTVEGFASDVFAVAEALHLSRYVLVGHSYGGAVVAACAGQRPGRVAGVVFADCAGDLHATPPAQLEPLRRGLREDYGRFTEKWFEGILVGSKPETREAVLRSLRLTPPDVFTKATDALYLFDLDAALGRYPGRRLSISSILFANPLAIHRLRADVPVRRIEGASHWLMMDRPDDFNRLLDEFLAGL